MNRPIKFRFWSNHLQKFVIPNDSIFVGALKDPDMNPMQFTGLKDKSGIEIYEGDVIDTTIKASRIMFVAWDEGTLAWGLVDPKSGHKAGDGYLDATMSYVQVVGNIMENPELLK